MQDRSKPFCKKFFQKKYIIILLILLFCIRLFKLDADAPTYNILQYTRVDEGHYAMQAINNIMHREMALAKSIDGGAFQVWQASSSFLNTAFCTLTLFLFGDNYYGLRMGSFLAGLISFILLLWMIAGSAHLTACLQNIDSDAKERRICFVLLAAGLMGICNFPFLVACRFVDPGIFRIVIIMLTLWYVWYSCRRQGAPGYFILGVLSAFSVTWGYLTNIFVFVPCGILLLSELITYYRYKKSQNPWLKIGKFILGILLAFVTGEVILYLLQRYTFIDDTLLVYQSMGDDRVSTYWWMYKNNLVALLTGNIFGYNAAFMVLSVIAVLFLLYEGLRRSDRFYLYLSFLSIGFAAQSVFTNDNLIRKSIVIYPVLLTSIAFFLLSLDLQSFKALKGKGRILLCLAVAALSALGFYMTVNRLSLLEEGDMNSGMKQFILWINLAGLLLFLLFLSIKKARTPILAWVVLAIAFLLPHLPLAYEYVVRAGYEDKTIMTQLGEIIGDDYVLGGYPYGYCLYNDFVPLSSTYDKFIPEERDARAKVLLQDDKVNYFIGNDQSELIEPWLEGTDYHWEVVAVFEKTVRDYGGNRVLYVFKKCGQQETTP